MLKRYNVLVHGTSTTLLLSDHDAALLGLTPADETTPAKARTAPNKSRKPANKKDGG